MSNTLIFPDGVRLVQLEEIPGGESERAEIWNRVQAASITPGFILKRVEGERFGFYVEANINAPSFWAVFCDLCNALLGAEAELLFSASDDDPCFIGQAEVSTIINVLTRHEYQLTHDGFVQFGLVSDNDLINEVFVAPSKHLKIWLCDEIRFRAVMDSHNVPEVSHLEFIDEYPRVTISLPPNKLAFENIDDAKDHLKTAIADGGRIN